VQSFGSLRAVKKASRAQIVAVIGEGKTKVVWPYITAGLAAGADSGSTPAAGR